MSETFAIKWVNVRSGICRTEIDNLDKEMTESLVRQWNNKYAGAVIHWGVGTNGTIVGEKPIHYLSVLNKNED